MFSFTLSTALISQNFLRPSAGVSVAAVKPSTSRLFAWGLQKLGQPVININNTATNTQTDAGSSLFGRRPVTTGNDERSPYSSSQASSTTLRDSHWESISQIDKSFRQHNLLMELSDDRWSQAEKLERISVAASVDNLLPQSLSGSTPAKHSLSQGGLQKDWNFDLDDTDFE